MSGYLFDKGYGPVAMLTGRRFDNPIGNEACDWAEVRLDFSDSSSHWRPLMRDYWRRHASALGRSGRATL